MKEIRLTQGKVASVDDGDYERVSAHRWCANQFKNTHSSRWYAVSWVGGQTVLLHRFILQARRGQEVDHKNGDGLDNRRENMRLCSSAQNHYNQRKQARVCSSRFKGVHKHLGKWNANIKVAGVKYYLGRFDDESTAAKAYDRAAIECFGDFALLNFPELLTLASKNDIKSSDVFAILGVTSVNEWKGSVDDAWVKVAQSRNLSPETIKK